MNVRLIIRADIPQRLALVRELKAIQDAPVTLTP